jgi:hypothetical protein
MQIIRDTEKEITAIHKLATVDGNPKEAIYRIAELMGANPFEMMTELRTQFLNQLGLEDVVTDEIQASLVQDERDYYKRKADLESKKYSQKLNADETRKSLDATIEKYGMKFDDAASIFQEMRKQDPNRDIQAEHIGEEYVNRQAEKLIFGIIDEVNPNIASKDRAEAYRHLRYFAENTEDVSQDMLFEMAASVYGNSSAKAVSKKIHNTKPTDTKRVSRESRNDPTFFSDLE